MQSNAMNRTIGIIGSGDMGSGVAMALVRAGCRVVTDLSGRSAHSKALAKRAGSEDLGSLPAVLSAADLVLSIVPPAAAADVAASVAAQCPAGVTFADCNAISPENMRRLAGNFIDRKREVVDIGIVGMPPQREQHRGTRLFVSGPARARVLSLEVPGIELIDLGETLGRASAMKMVYAALNKGVDALLTTILLAAGQLGVRDVLVQELENSQPQVLQRMRRRTPFLAATAERYVPEMREIAATFDSVGASPAFHEGAAWLYGLLAESSLASETRDSLPAKRSLDEAMAAFDEALVTRLNA